MNESSPTPPVRPLPNGDFTTRINTEKGLDGFTRYDGTIKFFAFVHALILREGLEIIMDFGAGRGGFWHDDPSVFRRHMRDLRRPGVTVTAVDVDAVVKKHPCSHEQVVVAPHGPLPFTDGHFDVIVSDMTFEHLERPNEVATELMRVLRPGGVICARTPNRFGYVTLVSSLIPNALHPRFLGRVQPDRKNADIFPTYYRLNSVSQVRTAFAGAEVSHYHDNGDPAYYFGNRTAYFIVNAIHAIMPRILSTTLCLFIRKPARA